MNLWTTLRQWLGARRTVPPAPSEYALAHEEVLAAVLSGGERAYAHRDGHTVLVDAYPNGVVAIWLDGQRCNQPAHEWYASAAQIEDTLTSVLSGYVPGRAIWQPARADLHAMREEWNRHPEPSGYLIGLGSVQFEDCALCRRFGFSTCTGHDDAPEALDRLEDEAVEGKEWLDE
jgi:hypothetical protein